MTKPKTKSKAVETLREPSAKERAAIDAAKEKWKGLPIRPELTVDLQNDGKTAALGPKHNDKHGPYYQLAEAFGSASNDFVTHQVNALLNVVGKGEEQVNSALAIVAAIAPQNELETSLAMQIAVSHNSALGMLMRMNGAQTLPMLTTAGNLATKFQRTQAALIETLLKLRNGGAQTVRHVHVYEGGQAVVADQFNHYGGQENGKKIGNQPYGPFASGSPAGGSPLPGQNSGDREAVPAPGVERA